MRKIITDLYLKELLKNVYQKKKTGTQEEEMEFKDHQWQTIMYKVNKQQKYIIQHREI